MLGIVELDSPRGRCLGCVSPWKRDMGLILYTKHPQGSIRSSRLPRSAPPQIIRSPNPQFSVMREEAAVVASRKNMLSRFS